MRHGFRLLLISSFVLMSACGSDRVLLGADALPPEQRVRLIDENMHFGSGRGFYIARVDGKWRGLGAVKAYELSPGIHTLTVVAVDGRSGGGVTRRYDFAAGQTYSLHGEFGQQQGNRIPYRIWVVDDSNGQNLLPLH
ncbi:MAG: hypothetical protein JSR34_04235 [Proteobacteria bacterium]|nr:hypothetical protein [Pseudomonadota bacterium]